MSAWLLLLAGCVPHDIPVPLVPGNPNHDFDGDGLTERDGDCDDRSAEVRGPTTFYGDGDGDGQGDPGAPIEACAQPDDAVDNADDCDPADGSGDVPLWYADTDGDGFGDPANAAAACEAPTGFGADATDCDDTDPLANPRDSGCWGLGTGTLSLATAERKLLGEPGRGLAGSGVSAAGDVDGDGLDDVLVGTGSGAVYLLHGPVSAAELAGADARLEPDPALQIPSFHGIGAGDVDGDGIDDLAFGSGSQFYVFVPGAVTVVLGPVPSGASVVDALGAAYITGDDERFGLSLAAAGDVGGGPGADLLVGTLGAAYLFHEPVGALGTVDAAAVWTEQAAGDGAGQAVAAGGDLTGDGVGELVIGAPGFGSAQPYQGAVYVLSGDAPGGPLVLADARLVGAAASDRAGSALALPGDYDGDGVDDLLVGAPAAGGAGRAYLVRGGLGLAGTLDLAGAHAVLEGEAPGDRAGAAVAGSGDLDGDHEADLLVGAPLASGELGTVYVVLGPTSGAIELSRADLRAVGERAGDFAGGAVAGVGDVDGDLRPDLLIGAPSEDTSGPNTGAAYLLLGASL